MSDSQSIVVCQITRLQNLQKEEEEKICMVKIRNICMAEIGDISIAKLSDICVAKMGEF